MGESNHQASSATRVGMRGAGGGAGGGEIVEVQGGHIVRSTGRKDRHSKVCTAKGTRDRRVRLSAHTAIQFYDVQDRLGYDRPSKAVDWLIKKAKAAIDELAELPAWDPTTVANTVANRTTKNTSSKSKYEKEYQFVGDGIGSGSSGSNIKVSNSNPSSGDMYSGDISSMHVHQQQQQQQIGGENPNHTSGLGLLPGSLESDSIADAFKSYFPMGKSTESATTTINFENYPPDLLSRTNSQSQDLRLSLQSLQEPILLHQQSHGHNESRQNGQQVLLPGTTAAHHPVFDVSGWSEHNHRNPQELGRFQRIAAWNASGGADTSGSGNGCAVSNGGFLFNLPPPSPAQTPPIAAQQAVLQPFFGQNQFFTQRGPLQSSNTPSIRAWIDPANAIDSNYDMQQVHQYHQAIYNGIGSASTPPNSIGGFSGFQIPARIQGEEEEHGGLLNKPSSASSKIRR